MIYPETTGADGPQEGSARRLSVAVAGGAVLLAFLLACPCAIAAIFAGRHFVATSQVAYREWIGSAARVAWSGEGRYGVVQSLGGDGVPLVVVWDRATGEVRSAEGFRVAAVESHGAAAWLVPVDRADLAEHTDGEWSSLLVSADAPVDAPLETLYLWDLGRDAPLEVESGIAEWSRWPGAAEWSASLLVDVSRGAYPHALLVGSRERPGESVRAELPDDLSTFEPVGWSPSGEYFALAELLEGSDGTDPMRRRVMVVAAADGSVAAEAFQNLVRGYGAAPVWHPAADVLVWADIGDPAFEPASGFAAASLLGMEPGGEAAGAFEVLGFPAPPEWDAPSRLRVCGAGAAEILVERADGVGQATYWQIGESAARLAGEAADHRVAPVYHADGGLLVLEVEPDQEAGTWAARLLHGARVGDPGRVVWADEWGSGEE